MDIDTGDRFPLGCVMRPQLSAAPHLFLGATLFLVLPICFAMGRSVPIQTDWFTMFFMAVGTLCLLGGLYCVSSFVKYQITSKEVLLECAEFPCKTSVSEPLSSYSALITNVSETTGLLGNREVYEIVLWHNQHSVKQVVLYAGSNRQKFEQRLETYKFMFKLPVNPPGVDINLVPNFLFDEWLKDQTTRLISQSQEAA